MISKQVSPSGRYGEKFICPPNSTVKSCRWGLIWWWIQKAFYTYMQLSQDYWAKHIKWEQQWGYIIQHYWFHRIFSAFSNWEEQWLPFMIGLIWFLFDHISRRLADHFWSKLQIDYLRARNLGHILRYMTKIADLLNWWSIHSSYFG